MLASHLDGGFMRAPQESATAFRAIMTAMVHPGDVLTLEGAQGPAPLSIAAAVLLLTMCDSETPIFLGVSYDTPEVRAWITFHTNAPFVGPEDAMFALGRWSDLSAISGFPIGTAQYPDRSVTFIVEVESLRTDGVELRGPGIQTTAFLNLPDVGYSQQNSTLFPLGIDQFFTCGGSVAALPRTTKVRSCM